ncbi:hypothetical protein [Celeribacter arenosi]|uniref:CAAX protease self-immunity n=1 Tax=Celeribacter arenosi TaxID=792649 RepID=A0ABP7K8Z3_9RHOB
MAPIFALVGLLWTVSSWGYYALVEVLEVESGYDDAPIVFAVFYLGWTTLAFWLFRRTLKGKISLQVIVGHAIALAPLLLAYATFVTFALPLLPDVSVYRAPPNPPEFMFASAWYYLPKSVDILFQQTLVAVMVRRADVVGLQIRTISILMAILFGGFHLTLALDGFTPLYVARFTVAATLFGLIVPYLYLRNRHGFRWAYGLHWGFYALDATITHLVLAVPPWAN